MVKNFRSNGTFPTNHSSCRKTRCIDLSYGVRMWTEVSFFLSQFSLLTDRQTDRQTDRRTDGWTDELTDGQTFTARPRMHSRSAVKIKRLDRILHHILRHLYTNVEKTTLCTARKSGCLITLSAFDSRVMRRRSLLMESKKSFSASAISSSIVCSAPAGAGSPAAASAACTEYEIRTFHVL